MLPDHEGFLKEPEGSLAVPRFTGSTREVAKRPANRPIVPAASRHVECLLVRTDGLVELATEALQLAEIVQSAPDPILVPELPKVAQRLRDHGRLDLPPPHGR